MDLHSPPQGDSSILSAAAESMDNAAMLVSRFWAMLSAMVSLFDDAAQRGSFRSGESLSVPRLDILLCCALRISTSFP